ncbi:hypothetical protein AURDEDRAFT_124097 [Auricularia subglabra TFB-10046 SS5]|nr:hypothetical protein AURDEDRAFT_124097 [Auricularia subglabra TFB-10046 SS5]
MDPTARLPFEVISSCLGHVSLQDILAAAGVCRRWRQIAIAHPTYWKHIAITSPTGRAARWFLLRLKRAGKRAVHVDLDLPSAPSYMLSIILSIIAEHLWHIAYLSCTVDAPYHGIVFSALCTPAPELSTFAVRLLADPRTHLLQIATLPAMMFECYAPRLASLTVQNISLFFLYPGEYPAVENLAIESKQLDLVRVQKLFAQFPNLRALRLVGQPFVHDQTQIRSKIWQRLKELYISWTDPASVWPLCALLPLGQLQHLVFGGVEQNWSSYLLAPFDGLLEIRVEDLRAAEASIAAHILERPSRRIRTFRLEGPPREFWDALAPTSTMKRVVCLTLPIALWPDATGPLPALPTLSELRVLFGLNGLLARETELRSISFTGLSSISLRCLGGPTMIDASELSTFLKLAIPDTVLPLVLRLEGVRLCGSERYIVERIQRTEIDDVAESLRSSILRLREDGAGRNCGIFQRSVALERASAEAVAEFIDDLDFLPDQALDVRVRVADDVLSPELALNAPGMPRAMQLVTALKLASERPVDVSSALSSLPQLTSLSLMAPSLCGLALLPVQLETLNHACLTITSSKDLDELLRSSAFDRVPTVELSAGQDFIPASLFAPLLRDDPDALSIDVLVERNPGSRFFRAVFACADRDITRTLNDISLVVDDGEIVVSSGSITHVGLAAHVKMVVLPLDMLECVGAWLGNAFPVLQSAIINTYPPEVRYAGRWIAPQLETILLVGGGSHLGTMSPLDVDFLRDSVFGGTEANVLCTGGLRIDKAPLLCRLEDFASSTHCFPASM